VILFFLRCNYKNKKRERDEMIRLDASEVVPTTSISNVVLREGYLVVVWIGPRWVSLFSTPRGQKVQSPFDHGVEEKYKIDTRELVELGNGSLDRGICSLIESAGFSSMKVVTLPDEEGIRDTFYRVI